MTQDFLSAYALVPPVKRGARFSTGLSNINEGIHTGAGDFVLRTYSSISYADLASIHYEHQLLSWLADRPLSFAVPAPVQTRAGALLARGQDDWVSLTPWRSGSRLDPERLDHVELLGGAIGELQMALQDYPLTPRPGRSLFDKLFYFSRPKLEPLTVTPEQLGLSQAWESILDLFAWWRQEAAELQAFVDGEYGALPTQVSHNDVTHNNVLVDEGRVSAVLDFEFATVASNALDLAQGLRVALRIDENEEPWQAASAFFRGYRRWSRLTQNEAQALPKLMRLRAALTVMWWLGHPVATDHADLIISRIERLRRTARWTQRHGQQLVDTAMKEAA